MLSEAKHLLSFTYEIEQILHPAKERRGEE